MYYALMNGDSVAVEQLNWVKWQDNGIFINCTENDGEGLIIDGNIYNVNGRTQLDKPKVDLIWKDDITELKFKNTLLEQQLTETQLALCELFETVVK